MYQNGWTPFIHAAEEGHLPVVEYLVEKGADMEAKDRVMSHLRCEAIHPFTHEYICECDRMDTLR